jgi:hypothetical protein
MARVLLSGPRAKYYEVDGTVGRNAQNDRADALLVQFMLYAAWRIHARWPQAAPTQVYSQSPLAWTLVQSRVAGPAPPTPFQHPKPDGDIAIDGIVGPQTISFIEYFQEAMARVGDCETNGQVAPLRTKFTSTLPRLNEILSAGLGDKAWFLPSVAGFPMELKPYLFI